MKMPAIIDKAISAITDSLKSVRSVYNDKREEVNKLNREINEIHQAPRTRAELEQALCMAVNRYVDQKSTNLVDWCQRFSRIHYDDREGEKSHIDTLAFLFISDVDREKSGIEALLREALLDGAKRLAASVDWPDNAMDQTTRKQRLAEIEPRRDALAVEMTEIHERALQNGITL